MRFATIRRSDWGSIRLISSTQIIRLVLSRLLLILAIPTFLGSLVQACGGGVPLLSGWLVVLLTLSSIAMFVCAAPTFTSACELDNEGNCHPVPCQKLNPNVLMMQPAEDRYRNDLAAGLGASKVRRVLRQRSATISCFRSGPRYFRYRQEIGCRRCHRSSGPANSSLRTSFRANSCGSASPELHTPIILGDLSRRA